MERILILAPHTDDAELGCGGTIAFLKEAGKQVYIASFSIARESLPSDASPDLLTEEFKNAMHMLGIPKENLRIYDYPVRRLTAFRQELLESLIALKKELKPDTVFLPSEHDVHQDHHVVYAEGLRAFKDITILGYELPWSHITYRAQAFMPLQVNHLKQKWLALQAYKSQIALGRPYFDWDFINGLARVRGVQIKMQFAESFEVVRINLGSQIGKLVIDNKREKFQILPLTSDDAKLRGKQLIELGRDLAWENWKLDNFLQELPDKWVMSSYAVDQMNQPIGYLIASVKGGAAHIHRIIVAPTWRSKKLGTALIRNLEEQIQKFNLARITLKVDVKNYSAIGFYCKLNFEVAAIYKEDNLLLMQKTVNGDEKAISR